MSTSIFKVQGHNFVAGLSWSIVPSVAAAKKGVEPGCAFLVGRSTSDASLSVGVGPREAAKCYSAGSVIGSVFQEAIIYSELEEGGSFWVCTLSGGLPGADWDVVLASEAEAKARFSEATSLLTGHVKIIGTVRGASMTVEEAITQALAEMAGEGAKPKQLAAALKPFRLQLLTFNWLKFAIFSVCLIVLVGLVLAGVLYREQVLDRRKRDQMLAQALKSQQELEALKAKRDAAIALFHSTVDRERERFGRQELALSQWNACEQVRRLIPFSSYGYMPHKLTCDFDTGKADLEWVATGLTTRLADRAALPGIVDKYSTDVNALSSFDLKPLDSGAPVTPLNPAAVRMAILDWSGVRLRSLRIEPNIAVVISPPQEIADEPGLVPVSLGSKAVLTLAASGASDLLTAPAAMRMLNSYAVQFNQIVWTQPSSAGVAMRATGVLYLPDAKL